MKQIPTSGESPFRRRTDAEPNQAGDYYSGAKRYFDQNFEVTVIKLYSGECYVTDQPGEMIMTILGSCISACMRDPSTGIGGMNHFLLPGNVDDAEMRASNDADRYGAFAMENLINGIMKLGGRKENLEVKLFGGGNVTSSSAMIGSKNVSFVHKFMKNEGLRVVSEDLGGTHPRRLHYFPDTGKVMMRKLRRKEDMRIVEREKTYQRSITQQDTGNDVELF